jgi:hypothetical protein
MTKRYTDFYIDFSTCPESANLHLWFPVEVFSKMESAMKAMSIQTREDLATLAVLYALRDSEADTTLTNQELQLSGSHDG